MDPAKPARRDVERLADRALVYPMICIQGRNSRFTRSPSPNDRVMIASSLARVGRSRWEINGPRTASVARAIHGHPPTHRSGDYVRRRDVEAGERVVEPSAVATTRLRIPGRVTQLALADVADRIKRVRAAVLADDIDDRGPHERAHFHRMGHHQRRCCRVPTAMRWSCRTGHVRKTSRTPPASAAAPRRRSPSVSPGSPRSRRPAAPGMTPVQTRRPRPPVAVLVRVTDHGPRRVAGGPARIPRDGPAWRSPSPEA